MGRTRTDWNLPGQRAGLHAQVVFWHSTWSIWRYPALTHRQCPGRGCRQPTGLENLARNAELMTHPILRQVADSACCPRHRVYHYGLYRRQGARGAGGPRN